MPEENAQGQAWVIAWMLLADRPRQPISDGYGVCDMCETGGPHRATVTPTDPRASALVALLSTPYMHLPTPVHPPVCDRGLLSAPFRMRPVPSCRHQEHEGPRVRDLRLGHVRGRHRTRAAPRRSRVLCIRGLPPGGPLSPQPAPSPPALLQACHVELLRHCPQGHKLRSTVEALARASRLGRTCGAATLVPLSLRRAGSGPRPRIREPPGATPVSPPRSKAANLVEAGISTCDRCWQKTAEAFIRIEISRRELQRGIQRTISREILIDAQLQLAVSLCILPGSHQGHEAPGVQ